MAFGIDEQFGRDALQVVERGKRRVVLVLRQIDVAPGDAVFGYGGAKVFLLVVYGQADDLKALSFVLGVEFYQRGVALPAGSAP